MIEMGDIDVREFERGYIETKYARDMDNKSSSWVRGREVARRVADLSSKVKYTKDIIDYVGGSDPAVLDFKRNILCKVIAEHKEFVRYYDDEFGRVSSKVGLARTEIKISILNLELSLEKLSYYSKPLASLKINSS